VINFDVPGTPEAYTHRIGRTGRSECEGSALTFLTSGDAAWLRATERKLGKAIPRRKFAGFESESDESGDRRQRSRPSGGRSGGASSRSGGRSGGSSSRSGGDAGHRRGSNGRSGRPRRSQR
jgi:ATP-dependent RNA helicase RhlE